MAAADGNDAVDAVRFPIATELNLNQPLVWYGSGSDGLSPSQFLSDVDQRRRRCGWSPRQTMDFIGVSLKGAALDWFRSSPRVSLQQDKDAFEGTGDNAWDHFQSLFLRSFLSGGKTHRIDQRLTFKQRPTESVLEYRTRCIESYQRFRDEQADSLADATTINLDLPNFDFNAALASADLEAAHFGHAAPGEGDDDGALHAAADTAARNAIRTQQTASLSTFLTNRVAELSKELMGKLDSFLICEFAKYLLIDGLHHQDVRHYAMELVGKGMEDVYLLWDYVHKYSDNKHPPNKSTAPRSAGGWTPGSAAASALQADILQAQADALRANAKSGGGGNSGPGRKDLPHTKGAVCGYCKKKNHTIDQCQKLKNKNAGKPPTGRAASLSQAAEGQQGFAHLAGPLLPTPPQPQQQQYPAVPQPGAALQPQQHPQMLHQPLPQPGGPYAFAASAPAFAPPPAATYAQQQPHQHQQGHASSIQIVTQPPALGSQVTNFASNSDPNDHLNASAWC